jgi:predicted Zn-dependent protease
MNFCKTWLAAVLVVAGSTSFALPNLGDGAEMSPAKERRLGDSIARSLYRDADYLEDPVVMDYVQSIWQPLLASAKKRGDVPQDLADTFAWEILLGRDRSVNAFALPGAYFGLHLGLVGVVSSRDELASVLAHELSHVTQRHIARNIAHQNAQAPWVMGAMILGILAASKSANNGQAANAMITGGQALAVQSQLNYSRDMEREADRVGFGVMTEAGFAAQGFVGMFEKLQQSNRLNDSGGFAYLRSHPLTTERISDMQNRMPLSGAASQSTSAVVSSALPWSAQDLEPALIGARARVLSNGGVDGLRVWQGDLKPAVLSAKPPAQQAAALYGGAFAALKLRDYAQAQTLCDQLRVRVQGNAAAVRLAVLQSDSPVASRAEKFLRAQAQTLQAQPAGINQAAQALRAWVIERPRDAKGWSLLAAAYTAQGRNVAAVRAQAQVDLLQLDYAAALARLRAAQDLVRSGNWGPMGPDHLEAAIVDTRAREVLQLTREQAVER